MRRMAPRLQVPRDRRQPQARQIGKGTGMLGKNAPICGGRRDHQQEPVRWVVPALEAEPAFDGLDVAEACLDLHTGPEVPAQDHGIPGALLRRAVPGRERRLAARRERRPDVGEEGIESAQVCRVPDRLPTRVELDGEIQPHHRASQHRLADLECPDLPRLRLRVARPGQADGTGDVGLAEPRDQACLPELLANRQQQALRVAIGAGKETLRARHPRIVATGTYLRLTWSWTSPADLVVAFGMEVGRRRRHTAPAS